MTAPTVTAATSTTTIQGANADGLLSTSTGNEATITLDGSTFDTTLTGNVDWFTFTNNDTSTITASVKEVSENGKTVTIQFSGNVAETTAQTITKIEIPATAINGLKGNDNFVGITDGIGITFTHANS